MNEIKNNFISKKTPIYFHSVENENMITQHTQMIALDTIMTSTSPAEQTEAEPTTALHTPNRHFQHLHMSNGYIKYNYIKNKINYLCNTYASTLGLTTPLKYSNIDKSNWEKILGGVARKGDYTSYEVEVMKGLYYNNWQWGQIAFVMRRTYGAARRARIFKKPYVQEPSMKVSSVDKLCKKIIPHLLQHGFESEEIALILQQTVGYISHLKAHYLLSKQKTDTFSSHSFNSSTLDSIIGKVSVPKQNTLKEYYGAVEEKIHTICQAYAKKHGTPMKYNTKFYRRNHNAWESILNGPILNSTNSRGYTAYEKEIIYRLYQNSWNKWSIAFVLQRSYNSIYTLIQVIGDNIDCLNEAQALQNEIGETKKREQQIISYLLKHGLEVEEIALIVQKDVSYISNFKGAEPTAPPLINELSIHCDIQNKIDRLCDKYAMNLGLSNYFQIAYSDDDKNWEEILGGPIRGEDYTEYEETIIWNLEQNNWKSFQIAFVMRRMGYSMNKKICSLRSLNDAQELRNRELRKKELRDKKLRKKELRNKELRSKGLPNNRMDIHKLCETIIPHLLKHGLERDEIAFILQQKVDNISNYIKSDTMSSKQQRDGSSIYSDSPSTVDPRIGKVITPHWKDPESLKKPHQPLFRPWEMEPNHSSSLHLYKERIWENQEPINQNERVASQQLVPIIDPNTTARANPTKRERV